MKCSINFNAVFILSFIVSVFSAPTLQAQRFHGHHGYSGGRTVVVRNYYNRPPVVCRPARPMVNVQVGVPIGYGRGHFDPCIAYPRYPALGLHIGYLPFGYTNCFVGNSVFCYYNNVYYRRVAEQEYEVVAPPLGAKIPQLPRSAKEVYIDGHRYYEFDGTYYQEELNANNQVLYEVVGTNGVLNQSYPQQPTYQAPQVGDVVYQLPENCKLVVLNGVQYYVSPNNLYYQEIINNGRTTYKIVGK